VFETGNIVFFKPFYFNNGDPSKEKYLIVLKTTKDGKAILGSLPTRNNKIEAFVNIPHGCINKNENMFNCYLFEKNRIVCDNGFCFDMHTFIYGGDIEYYSIEIMNANYPTENVHYKVQGKLTDAEYKSIIKCLCESNSVKRGIQRILMN